MTRCFSLMASENGREPRERQAGVAFVSDRTTAPMHPVDETTRNTKQDSDNHGHWQ